jgi:hypothetical protein
VLNLPGGRAGLPLDSDERALLGGFVDHFSG